MTRPEEDFIDIYTDDEEEEVKAVQRITQNDEKKNDKKIINGDASTVAKVDSKKKSKKMFRIFRQYATRASFNGMVYILESHKPIVKALWTLLVLAAVGASIFHLFYLFSSFYEFQKYSKVNLKFSSLQFPAVTVCNVNMMRFSKRANASEAVRNLFDEDNDYNATATDEPDLKDSGLLKWVAEREQAFCTYCKYCWDQGQNRNSSLYEFDDYFTYVYNKQPLQVRRDLGHQLSGLLRMCSFAGRSCGYTSFKQIVSPQYGNCYTIENPDFISRKSGAASGLELILSLETEDYSPVTTSSKGARVIIHEPQTIPFQDENDIAISPGMHTMIGLRQVKINRMGAPYAPCEPGEEFLRNNGYKYTRNLCQKMCEDQHIRTTCRCYEYEVDFNTTRKENLQDHVGQCENKSEQICLYQVRCQLETDETTCNCKSPCSEIGYEQTISTLCWPTDTFVEYIKPEICRVNPPAVCNNTNATNAEIRQELVKLSVYFTDLNYEELTDQPNYEFSNFLSDIGGSIGLWTGLSVISLFEIVHLVLEIVRYIACRKWRKKEPQPALDGHS